MLRAEEFEAEVARFFARPGNWSSEAKPPTRHTGASPRLSHMLDGGDEETVAVVTHGRVLTLFVTRALGLDPFPFWKRLGLPSFAVVAWPDPRLVALVDRVD